jgi:hypothetical protein
MAVRIQWLHGTEWYVKFILLGDVEKNLEEQVIFQVLPRRFSRGTEDNHEKSQDYQYPDRMRTENLPSKSILTSLFKVDNINRTIT